MNNITEEIHDLEEEDERFLTEKELKRMGSI